jgi:hypothetical protein
MWADIVKNVVKYPSAVVTSIDSTGYPFSFRCTPELEHAVKVLRIPIPEGTDVQSGPASLLCHRHDEWLWNMKSFSVRGVLEHGTQGWNLRPLRFIHGDASQDLRGMLRFVRLGRRNAKRYLKRRGLPRPKVPWDEICAAWTETKAS